MNENIIHIDFYFNLGVSRSNLNFENAQFKITNNILIFQIGNIQIFFNILKVF